MWVWSTRDCTEHQSTGSVNVWRGHRTLSVSGERRRWLVQHLWCEYIYTLKLTALHNICILIIVWRLLHFSLHVFRMSTTTLMRDVCRVAATLLDPPVQCAIRTVRTGSVSVCLMWTLPRAQHHCLATTSGTSTMSCMRQKRLNYQR